jgi:hypothetical protein
VPITVSIVNADSIALYVTVRDLLAGVAPPVLPPTLIEPQGSGDPQSLGIPISVLSDDAGKGKIRWSAQDTDGAPVGQDTAAVKDKAAVDISREAPGPRDRRQQRYRVRRRSPSKVKLD